MRDVVKRGVLRVIGPRATRAAEATAPERLPESAALMAAVPVPVVLLDSANRFRFANPAAEHFLGYSMAQLRNFTLADLVPGDNPVFLLIEQVRAGEVTISEHDLTLESPRLRKQGITVQGSPLPEEPGSVLLVLQDASTGDTECLEGVDSLIAPAVGIPNDALVPVLSGNAARPVLPVGDCVAARSALEAIFEGHQAGRTL